MSPTDPSPTGPSSTDPSPTDPVVPGSDAFASRDTDPEVVAKVTGLRKAFGSNEVLKGIDFEVRRGEVIALIGPSGSGKTTVLRSLNSLEVPDAGTIELSGGLSIRFGPKVAKRELLALRDRSSMVFQHFNLFPHKTVLENVIEGPVQVQKRPRAEAKADAERLLDRVGLLAKQDAYPFELSGGQQQRVGIVRALALKPELLLFDEPTSALDPELVGDVLQVMKELADEGWTMVVVTHELEFARQVATQVLFMDGGVIVESGPPNTVLKDPRQPRTQQFLHRILNPLD